MARVFCLLTLMAGGCDRGSPAPEQRTPRLVASTAELFVVDDVAAKDVRVTRELTADLATPAPDEGIPPRVAPARARRTTVNPPKADAPPETDVGPETDAVPDVEGPAAGAGATPPAPAPAPLTPARAAAEPGWYSPPPKRPHETAINISLAIGASAVGVGVGTAATMGDGSRGESAFAIGSLAVGLASLSTAFVLYVTEPSPRHASTGIRLAPGMLGVRGTF